jgi:hypothetical protein
VVLRSQEDPARPRVRLVATADGTSLQNGAEIDLLEKNTLTKAYARSISLAVDAASKNLDVAQLVTAPA